MFINDIFEFFQASFSFLLLKHSIFFWFVVGFNDVSFEFNKWKSAWTI